MKKNIKKWQEASREAHRISRWAKTMTKWLISRGHKNGANWHVVNFVGTNNSESRGIVDLLAIRKDHRTNDRKIKRGDLFEVVLFQPCNIFSFSNRRRNYTVETGIQTSPCKSNSLIRMETKKEITILLAQTKEMD